MSQTDSYVVLCIEERDDDPENYDQIWSRLFLAYDAEQETYVVYGKRLSNSLDYEPYFFRAENASQMYKFVQFVIGKESICSYTLYNYNNMSRDLEDSDYNFMETNMLQNYEMAAYDSIVIKKKKFKNMMSILKNTYNY
jgi:hypothetical protein